MRVNWGGAVWPGAGCQFAGLGELNMGCVGGKGDGDKAAYNCGERAFLLDLRPIVSRTGSWA